MLSYLSTVLIITLVAMVVVVAGLYLWWIGPVILGRKPLTGEEALVGKEGTVTSNVTPEGGEVKVDGIVWKAMSRDGQMQIGEKVVVTSVSSLTLIVRKIEK